MKWKQMVKAVLPAAAAAAGAGVFLLAPAHAAREQKAPFMDRNYAHRGLHKKDKSVPENSLAAFRRAVKAGYGVEMDVHITADDRLVVFHDDTLRRMIPGAPEGRIETFTLEELRQFRLLKTDEQIPTLEDALAVLAGRVPLILEIKSGPRNDRLCALVSGALARYPGPVCIESFDPFILRWFKKHEPSYLRGQLAQKPKDYKNALKGARAFAAGNLLLNAAARPHFISYRIGEKPATVRLCEAMGAMRAGWTSREWKHEQDYDMVIFEHYKPGVWFRADI